MWTDVLKDHKFQLVVTGVVAAASGAAVGHVISIKKLEAKYNDIAETEIADAKRFYNQSREAVLRAQKPGTPGEIVAELHPGEQAEGQLLLDAAESLTKYQGVTEVVVTEEVITEMIVKSNTFDDNADSTFDMQTEMESRDLRFPYLISEEEWTDAEPGFNQITIAYYAGDGVLVDDEDKPLDNPDVVIGDNLHHFGHGTEDPDTMFIRNTKLKADIEVVRSPNHFAHEVLGHEIEHSGGHRQRDRHERRHPQRKFRDNDE